MLRTMLHVEPQETAKIWIPSSYAERHGIEHDENTSIQHISHNTFDRSSIVPNKTTKVWNNSSILNIGNDNKKVNKTKIDIKEHSKKRDKTSKEKEKQTIKINKSEKQSNSPSTHYSKNSTSSSSATLSKSLTTREATLKAPTSKISNPKSKERIAKASESKSENRTSKSPNTPSQQSLVASSSSSSLSSPKSLSLSSITPTTRANQSKSRLSDPTPKHERFIIYVCDKSNYCYGLGDRQRAVSSLYVLSLLTNRTFGVIWTQPCPLTQFLQPNEVNWDIPAWKLNGKSSIELEFLKPKNWLNLEIPFNQQYPQDVVYVRSNHNLVPGLQKNKFYRPSLPKWARKRYTYVHGHAWKMLMKPTPLIRKPLNDMLVKIYQTQQLDLKIVESLSTYNVCRDACGYLGQFEEKRIKGFHEKNMTVSYQDVFNDTRLSQDKRLTGCLSELGRTLSSYSEDISLVSWRNLNTFCKSEKINRGKQSRMTNDKISVDSIRKAKGYDVVDLNLVCIHARIGRNPDMTFDKPRNSIESTKALWDFARPYMDKGQHLYIATDYDKVRQDSKVHFGLRAHSSSTPIVHIASVQEHQDETEGMALALWEQLLLMTSCKTLVQSHSGFSIMAGAIREDLIGNDERYWFEGGIIRQIG